ncbi:hypothetical protein AB0I72_01665 [Nocardiopsis sp. NPDC049922]|uniref:hypothetical protein n=1 Tax=Nocardiopsis sp. NPDC049922 TaxID=3155157 RepID=UPI0033C1907A
MAKAELVLSLAVTKFAAYHRCGLVSSDFPWVEAMEYPALSLGYDIHSSFVIFLLCKHPFQFGIWR